MASSSDRHGYLPEIKRHSLEKLRRHSYYAGIFASAMRKKWPTLVYIGLYSGAGRAVLAETGEIVDTSAMAVLTQRTLFDRYIFVDADPRCTAALESRVAAVGLPERVEILNMEVNDCISAVQRRIPAYSTDHGVLSLCFVDPFRIDLNFEVIRRLGQNWIDFLVMMPLGFDVRRNVRRYLTDPEFQARLAEFIDCPAWVQEWQEEGQRNTRHFARFALGKFDLAMERLGFRRRAMHDAADVKVSGMAVFLYSLLLYSKHEKGEEFWKQTLRGTSLQAELELTGV